MPSYMLSYIMPKRTSKNIHTHPCYRDLIFKKNGENPAGELKHFRNSPFLSHSVPGIIQTTAYRLFSFVPSLNLVHYFSNLSAQNNHCPGLQAPNFICCASWSISGHFKGIFRASA